MIFKSFEILSINEIIFRSIVIKLYADDSKIIAQVDTEVEIRTLQSDLDAISAWCKTWCMKLNVEKCKVMHIGRNNQKATYFLTTNDSNRLPIFTTLNERDLGIVFSPDLKFSSQAAHAASKANSVLGMLKNTFVSRDPIIWATLYRTYVRPHLEFAISVWNPFLKRDKKVLEKVQRRATRLPKPLRGLSYETRLDNMGLTTLEMRRTRGYLIQIFKILRGLDIAHLHSGISWSEPRAGKRPQIRREITSKNVRHNFFVNRIANTWNQLPDNVVESNSVNEFKSRVDHWFKSRAEMAAS